MPPTGFTIVTALLDLRPKKRPDSCSDLLNSGSIRSQTPDKSNTEILTVVLHSYRKSSIVIGRAKINAQRKRIRKIKKIPSSPAWTIMDWGGTAKVKSQQIV